MSATLEPVEAQAGRGGNRATTADAPAARPPVLLLHGLTGAPADLQVITRRLQRAGYEVVTPMLPGHGVDEEGLLATGWRDWLAAAEAQLFSLTEGGGQAFVGGLSMGAVLALALAARHPRRVRGVASFSATMAYDGWVVPKPNMTWTMRFLVHVPLVNRYRFEEREPYGIKDERLRAKMVELLHSGAIGEAGLPFMPGKSLVENLKLIADTKRRLASVTAPVLLVHAVEDDITDIKNAEAIAAKVSGPVTKLYLEDSYHLVTVDRERNTVAQATTQFFDALCGGVR